MAAGVGPGTGTYFAREKKEGKNASSVVEREQDGVKDSSPALLGSCTRGWRRCARSRRNYFLFSDPEREVDCLTSCSSRVPSHTHICGRQSLRNIFCSHGIIHGQNRNCPIYTNITSDVTQALHISFTFKSVLKIIKLCKNTILSESCGYRICLSSVSI